MTKIPSNGFYQPTDNVLLNSVGMVEVYPRTAADEMHLSNPDFLVSGVAVEKIIASCVPGVKDPRFLPINDAHVLLLAIQKASKGSDYSVELSCPECEADQRFAYNLDYLLSSIDEMPEETYIVLDEDNELVAHLAPWSLSAHNANFYDMYKMMQHGKIIDAQKASGTISAADYQLEKDKMVTYFSEKSISVLVHCITSISVAGQHETNKSAILEFLNNCVAQYATAIGDKVATINNSGVNPQSHTCKECGHEWKSTPEFNPTTFFVPRSPT